MCKYWIRWSFREVWELVQLPHAPAATGLLLNHLNPETNKWKQDIKSISPALALCVLLWVTWIILQHTIFVTPLALLLTHTHMLGFHVLGTFNRNDGFYTVQILSPNPKFTHYRKLSAFSNFQQKCLKKVARPKAC